MCYPNRGLTFYWNWMDLEHAMYRSSYIVSLVFLFMSQFSVFIGTICAICTIIEAEWRLHASVNSSSLIPMMACRLVGAEPLSELMLVIFLIRNLELKNKLQWNLKHNSYIFIKGSAFENIDCKMMIILCRSQWVKQLHSIANFTLIASSPEKWDKASSIRIYDIRY